MRLTFNPLCQSPQGAESQTIVASLPGGTKCTGGKPSNKCLVVRFQLTWGHLFANCSAFSNSSQELALVTVSSYHRLLQLAQGIPPLRLQVLVLRKVGPLLRKRAKQLVSFPAVRLEKFSDCHQDVAYGTTTPAVSYFTLVVTLGKQQFSSFLGQPHGTFVVSRPVRR